MKVKELIKSLSNEDPEGEVYLSHDSHDHWGNVLASPVNDVEEKEIHYSAYHQKYSVPSNEDNDDDEDKRKVVVLLS